MKTIYLAGNIAGLEYDVATNWRSQVTEFFEKVGLKVLDPMRGKEHLAGTVIGLTHDSVGCSAKEIFERDMQDVENADVIFAYITAPTIGTTFELGAAWKMNKYIVIVTTDELIEHPFLSESASFITTRMLIGTCMAGAFASEK